MENYILRIYRFEKNNPKSLVGIVESVDGDKRDKRAFTCFDDLWDIINSQPRELSPDEKMSIDRGHSKA